MILCYEQDQEALALHKVKAHDVTAFAASKAFQSGDFVSLEVTQHLHAVILEGYGMG